MNSFPMPMYSTNPTPSWCGPTNDVVMNDGNGFSFLEEPNTKPHFQKMGGTPMEKVISNESASSAQSNSTTATSLMSFNGNQKIQMSGQQNFSIPKALNSMQITDAGYHPFYDELQQASLGQFIPPTPSSLGWADNTRVSESYDLVLEKPPTEPYLVLKTPSETSQGYNHEGFYMPNVVCLDQAEYPTSKKYHPCLYPGRGCWKDGERRWFTRAADLERHYNVVHHASDVKMKCDYPKCSRHVDPFTRKDHCRDHYKEFHKEDIGAYKGGKTTTDKAKWQEKQAQWENERQVKPHWWRCPRCLDRIDVEKQGWHCGNCKRPCEDHRYKARMKLSEDVQELYDEEEAMTASSMQSQSYLPNCPTCQDFGCVGTPSGGSEPCPECSYYAYAASPIHPNDGSWSQ